MSEMGSKNQWSSTVERALSDRRQSNIFRHPRALKILDSTHVEINHQRLVNFASNNYLGLTHHPKVIEAFTNAAREFGIGSGAAALVTGYSELHQSAEQAIATWKGTEAAVLLGSGYTANLAAVQTLLAVAKGRARFLIDKLSHASLIDAVRSVDANFRIFPHKNLEKLRRLLEGADANVLQVVVTESIFSMEGDAANLAGIAELKQEFGFLLLMDEAHGSGVYGPGGSGYAAELGLSAAVDLTIVTLSKAIGCVGGAVCGSKLFCDGVVNFGRPYIFSTAIPAPVAAAVETAVAVMRNEPWRQARLRQLALRVSRNKSDSPIIPIILGDETAALAESERLMQAGMLVVAIRPPAVAPGTSRLRVTVSCEHTDEEIEKLITELDR